MGVEPLMSGISVFIKGATKSSSSTMWEHREKIAFYEQGKKFLPGTESAGTFISGFQPPELQQINVCCL